jgi:hypothetical protein
MASNRMPSLTRTSKGLGIDSHTSRQADRDHSPTTRQIIAGGGREPTMGPIVRRVIWMSLVLPIPIRVDAGVARPGGIEPQPVGMCHLTSEHNRTGCYMQANEACRRTILHFPSLVPGRCTFYVHCAVQSANNQPGTLIPSQKDPAVCSKEAGVAHARADFSAQCGVEGHWVSGALIARCGPYSPRLSRQSHDNRLS